MVCGWEEVSKPHLEHRDVVLPVDLVGGRVKPRALAHVLVQDAAALHVAQAELTQVQLRKSGRRSAHTHTHTCTLAITRRTYYNTQKQETFNYQEQYTTRGKTTKHALNKSN